MSEPKKDLPSGGVGCSVGVVTALLVLVVEILIISSSDVLGAGESLGNKGTVLVLIIAGLIGLLAGAKAQEVVERRNLHQDSHL